LARGADLGIAFDGDGDRVLMVDQNGAVLDGDELLFIIARHRVEAGRLPGGVVGTLMSNFGMEQALTQLSIPFARSKVGDRYILEELRKRNWELGGEGSGHILCLDLNTTGDGIVSAFAGARGDDDCRQVTGRIAHWNGEVPADARERPREGTRSRRGAGEREARRR
jgi:phosphomannomutase